MILLISFLNIYGTKMIFYGLSVTNAMINIVIVIWYKKKLLRCNGVYTCMMCIHVRMYISFIYVHMVLAHKDYIFVY